MSIKESMLNIVSDLAQNDYIRAVTYGGYSRRVEVSELAKSVVEDYTGSSLAGENQSVQGAFSALETEIQNVEQDVTAEINDAILNILPTDTAAGEIASFPDGSDLSPALSVLAGIEPVQDLNGYDAPWVGGAGKNFAKPTQRIFVSNGVTYSVDADGKITLTGTATGATNFTLYTGQNAPETSRYTVSMYGAINAKVNGGNTYTTTVNSGASLSPFVISTTSGTTYNESFYVQIEKSSTATAYTPYENICPISGHDDVTVTVADDVDNPTVSEDYTTTLPSTTYGGTLDIVSGVLTVTKKLIDLGTKNWTMVSASDTRPYNYFYASLPDAVNWQQTSLPAPIISSNYPNVSSSQVAKEGYDKTMSLGGKTFFIADSSYSSAADFKTAMNGVQLCYELETPTTIQLTETQVVELFKGYNNVFSEAGDMSVTYKADIQLYIDKQTNELRVAILALS